MEFMEREAINRVVSYLGDVNLFIKNDVQAHLLVEVDGHNIDVLMQDCEKIAEIVQPFDCDDILFADNDTQKSRPLAVAPQCSPRRKAKFHLQRRGYRRAACRTKHPFKPHQNNWQ